MSEPRSEQDGNIAVDLSYTRACERVCVNGRMRVCMKGFIRLKLWQKCGFT